MLCWKCGKSESASIAGPFGVCAESLSSSPLPEASRLDRCTRSGQVRYYVTRPKSRTMVRTMAPRVSESESISQRQVNPFNSRPASWQLGLDNPFQQPLERALSVTLAAKPRRLRCRLRSRGLTRPGHITNPRGFMDYKLNPRVDLGFVFMSMGAFWTHVIFIFYEYTIVRASSSNPAPSLCIFFTIYRTYTLYMLDFFQRGLTGTDGHRGSQGCLRWQTVHRRPI